MTCVKSHQDLIPNLTAASSLPANVILNDQSMHNFLSALGGDPRPLLTPLRQTDWPNLALNNSFFANNSICSTPSLCLKKNLSFLAAPWSFSLLPDAMQPSSWIIKQNSVLSLNLLSWIFVISQKYPVNWRISKHFYSQNLNFIFLLPSKENINITSDRPR